jgi:hypothetical protein
MSVVESDEERREKQNIINNEALRADIEGGE